jgi:glycosyltransferase involved in cell wall biosynthesis
MRLLFCCEFYFPSVGGVQEVMRQIAERLARRGHDVTVATTKLGNRNFDVHNGVKIVEFAVTGNLANGISGEVERYRAFVQEFQCDALLIKAAQQWTFDALWPVFDSLSCRKVFIPCGFSGLYEPNYVGYFEEMPSILRKFDHLIFYADRYRDTDFARTHGIENYSIVPNGASEIEFGVERDVDFRRRHGIPEDSFVILTVGSITGMKGHRELLEAFVKYPDDDHRLTFIMNGNPPPVPDVVAQAAEGRITLKNQVQSATEDRAVQAAGPAPLLERMGKVFRSEGVIGLLGRVAWRIQNRFSRMADAISKTVGIYHTEGARGVRYRLVQRMARHPLGSRFLAYSPVQLSNYASPISFWLSEAKRARHGKQLLVTDFDRPELVQAYMAADLFVFASNIEYSPLVLFETCAAGTPFLSVPVGNAEEIALWTQGGIICTADKDGRGYTRASPEEFCRQIKRLTNERASLREMGERARSSWQDRYTWEKISRTYEKILAGDLISD